MKKAALEEALAFGSRQVTFSFEDTHEKCYRDVIEALQDKGWKRIPYRKRSKVEKKRCAIPLNPLPAPVRCFGHSSSLTPPCAPQAAE